jgi:hypothetical protein
MTPSLPLQYATASRYGVAVIEDVEMESLRGTRCMCVNCSRDEFCPISFDILTLCKNRSIAVLVTRCPNFDLRSR